MVQVSIQSAVSWARSAAAFLESGDPVGQLTRDFLIAVIIALASSLLVNFFIGARERRKRRRERGPMRRLVLDIVSQAHAQVFEALCAFDEKNYARTKTRLHRLGAEILRIRGETATQVFGGLSYFENDERAAIVAYLAALDWKDISTLVGAEHWQRELDAKMRKVISTCHDHSLAVWTKEQSQEISAHLQRLEEVGSNASGGALASSVA
jgi:hypothetical protein